MGNRTAIVLSLAVGLLLATVVRRAAATAPDNAKTRGDAYHFSLGQMYDRHAVHHLLLLQEYADGGESVPHEVLREHLAGIVANILAAEKSYARLSEATRTNPAASRQLSEARKQSEAILQRCYALDKSAGKNPLASANLTTHCAQIRQALAAARESSRAAASSVDLVSRNWDEPVQAVTAD